MKCPKCGLTQKESTECSGCGIIIARYLQRQNEPIPTSGKSRIRKTRYRFLEIDKELRDFYHAQSLLLGAGLGAIEALSNYLTNTKSLKDRAPYRKIEATLADGRPVSQAMLKSTDYFPTYHSRLVEAGEKSGNPEQMYRELHDIVDRKIKMFELIIRESRKPAITLLASFFILPSPVLFSAGPIAYLKSSLLPLLASAFVIFFCYRIFKMAIRSRGISLALDRVLLDVPVYNTFQTSQFIRVFRTLYSAGVDSASAFAMSTAVVGNSFLVEILNSFQPYIEKGETLSSILTETGAFPQDLHQFVSTGESSGKLDSSLKKYLEISDDSFNHQLGRLATNFSAGLGLLMAMYVGYEIVKGYMVVLPG